MILQKRVPVPSQTVNNVRNTTRIRWAIAAAVLLLAGGLRAQEAPISRLAGQTGHTKKQTEEAQGQTSQSQGRTDVTQEQPSFADSLNSSASDSISTDTLAADSSALDSMSIEVFAADSLLAPDSLLVDSLAGDSLLVDTVEVVTLAPLDTAAAADPGPLAWSWEPREWNQHLPKNLGVAVTLLPGLYPRQSDLSGQPFYALTPGADGRDTRLLYRGRSFDDPITDAPNLAIFALEELERIWFSPAWTADGPSVSGEVIRLDSHHEYPTTALSRIRFRQELYGLGNADWRISQRMSPTFAYHIGVNITQYRGRYEHTEAASSRLRFGMNTITHLGLLDLSWIESDLKWERPFVIGTTTNRREEIDIALSGGRRWQGNYRELAAWYGRSRFGYPGGSEDGNRLGARLQWEPRLGVSHQLLLRSDIERVAMRMQPLTDGRIPGGSRFVLGTTLQDDWRRGLLRAVAALRGEASQYSNVIGDTSPFGYGRAGGRFALELGDSLGPRGEAGITRSWRLPSLDETFGFWYRDQPSRSMDLIDIPGGINKVYGNPTLKPIMTTWKGAGVRWVLHDRRQIRLRVGQRSWDRMYTITQQYYGIYGRSEVEGFDALEATGQMDVHLWGPFSTAGAYTWLDLGDRQAPMPERWGWASLRTFNSFYGGQLLVMTAATARHWGEYNYAGFQQKEELQLDLMVTLEIQGLQVFYSRSNLNDQIYSYTPGFPGSHRNEIWGVRWNLRN